MERFWFDDDAQRAPIALLSGGERRRLQLLLTLLERPNVLLLDEPTNDLDLDTLRALEDFLDDWPGAAVIVSHDRALLDRTCDDGNRLTLVSAPAGFGKTTLLTDWLDAASRQRPGTGTGWLSLDDGDNDLSRLLAHLAAALERTGLPVVVNTSLNTAGRPMVDDPRDALELFGSAPVDALVLGPHLVRRERLFAGERAAAAGS